MSESSSGPEREQINKPFTRDVKNFPWSESDRDQGFKKLYKHAGITHVTESKISELKPGTGGWVVPMFLEAKAGGNEKGKTPALGRLRGGARSVDAMINPKAELGLEQHGTQRVFVYRDNKNQLRAIGLISDPHADPIELRPTTEDTKASESVKMQIKQVDFPIWGDNRIPPGD